DELRLHRAGPHRSLETEEGYGAKHEQEGQGGLLGDPREPDRGGNGDGPAPREDRLNEDENEERGQHLAERRAGVPEQWAGSERRYHQCGRARTGPPADDRPDEEENRREANGAQSGEDAEDPVIRNADGTKRRCRQVLEERELEDSGTTEHVPMGETAPRRVGP